MALNSLWPIDATCCHGSGNGLVPDDSKPLLGPKLTYQQYDLQLQEYREQLNHNAFSTEMHLISNQWLSAKLQYLQCISNGDTAVLH